MRVRFAPVLIVVAASLPTRIEAASPAPQHVDVVLVLAADVSRSITPEKFDLQRKGYAAALTDPRVLDAIEAGRNHRIAIAFVEWSGASSQSVTVDWSLIDGKERAAAFASRVLDAPRAFANRTAIGAALAFSQSFLAGSPYVADRRVIDVSGDGTNNEGPDVDMARDAALANGVSTINGLVILSSDTPSAYLRDHENPPGGLQAYYRQNVAGGMGSFVLVAKSFDSFGRALVAKLVQEIS